MRSGGSGAECVLTAAHKMLFCIFSRAMAGSGRQIRHALFENFFEIQENREPSQRFPGNLQINQRRFPLVSFSDYAPVLFSIFRSDSVAVWLLFWLTHGEKNKQLLWPSTNAHKYASFCAASRQFSVGFFQLPEFQLPPRAFHGSYICISKLIRERPGSWLAGQAGQGFCQSKH